MEQKRPDPDKLLASISKEEAAKKRGKLKIFLGMCPGVGKTYSMLQAARERQSEGIDVLIGVVETHRRKETEALLEGLVTLSKVDRTYRGIVIQEFDLDAALAIRPQLIIIDELAHTNAPESRHPKRCQDVIELLNAGIDVYSTLNVQHIESRADAVRQITGITMRETIPDSILDEADEIALIDLPPDQLRERLKDGKVYIGEQAATAADNFFREENLIALREMALRITAEHVNRDLREAMSRERIVGPWKSGERLMVAIGPTPYSESLIRWTRSAAASLGAPWIAAYVETPKALNEEDKKRLARNLTLARQLGAEVVVRSGIDIAETLLEVARQNNVSQICIGKPSGNIFLQWFRDGAVIQKLINQSGNIDIHMVRVKSLGTEKIKSPFRFPKSTTNEYGFVVGIVIGVTILNLLLEQAIGYSSVALTYLLAVVISGVYLSRFPVLILAALSATLWNFLFIPPKYTFLISSGYDAIMFLMYFIVAIVMGGITTRLREREQAERKQEDRISTLYQLAHSVVITHNPNQAIQMAIEKLESIFKVRASLFLIDQTKRPDFNKPRAGSLALSQKEKSVANFTFQKQEPAGRFTETLPESQNFYLPIVSMGKSLGVLAINPKENLTWAVDQRNLIESFSALLTVVLEKEIAIRTAQENEVRLASEKLHSALLDSVSHELKTPLTVIQGSLEHLTKEKNQADFDRLTHEIELANNRLLKTVGSLLDMSRLDSERLELHLEWHDVHDVVNAAIDNLQGELKNHSVKTKYPESLPLVKIDSAVIRQVLINLLSNAATYSKAGTEIMVVIQLEGKNLIFKVIDHGPGIAEEELDRVFEKFYRGEKPKTGGLGLGLSIAKRFVEVHGGKIEARNQETDGACFTLTLPVEIFNSNIQE